MRVLGIALLMILSACHKRADQITYKPYSDFFKKPSDERLARLKNAFDSLRQPFTPSEVLFDSGWLYMKGSSSEGLVASNIKSGGEKITLPHRILSPDTPLWYTNQLEFSSPGVLVVSADDGAQVFVEGRQRHQLEDGMFSIDSAGTFKISVRVLNNAMSGGLRRVTFLSEEEFNAFNHSKDLYDRLRRVVEKAILFPTLADEQLQAVEAAVSNPGTLEMLQRAENLFDEFPFLTGPWITRLDSGKISITVLTDSDHPVILQFGRDPDHFDNIQKRDERLAQFIIDTSECYYTLSCGRTNSPVYRWQPASSRTFSFNVWADSQSGWDSFQQNVENLSDHNDAFGVAAGDLVAHGSDPEQWRIFFNILGASSSVIPYYLVAGNHDYDGYYEKLIPENYNKFTHHSKSYFSWYYGNCAFIAIDPNENFPIGFSHNQREWFTAELESLNWKKAKWHFIVLHQPPFSEGWAGYEGDASVRELLEPVIESAAIDFVVAGHTHDYERLSKQYGRQLTTFLIVGGAGGSLEPPESSETFKMDTVIKSHHMGRFTVSDHRIQFIAMDTARKIIDSFEQIK